MKSKTKPEPTLRERAAALALMASEVLLMVLDEPVETAAPAAKAAKPKTAKASKSTGKPRGRKPMTEEQRAAAKAERDAKSIAFMQPGGFEPMANPQPLTSEEAAQRGIGPGLRKMPQPVTRESLAARSAVGSQSDPEGLAMFGGASYFTKASGEN